MQEQIITTPTNQAQPGSWLPAPREVDSVLALGDIRQRLIASQISHTQPAIQSLLELDPLTVIRLLRIARAPIHAGDKDLRSVKDLVQHFGHILVMRALEVKTVAVECSDPIRKLWIHSLATAHACRELAQDQGYLDPDEAYLQGLLIDLPSWATMLTELGAADPQTFYKLLGAALPTIGDRQERRRRGLATSQENCLNTEDLLCKGELLASLAGYWHPAENDLLSQSKLLRAARESDLISSQGLRKMVSSILLDANLLHADLPPEPSPEHPPENQQLFEWQRDQGNLADVVSALQNCRQALRYRDILTATTAAALRFLDYERATVGVWNSEVQCCWIRAKSDMAACRLEPLKVVPTAHERGLLEQALSQSKAISIRATAIENGGLLNALGADEVLCVPINPSFQSPSFLFLDRTLTRRKAIETGDLKAVEGLASTVSIVTENLLLKKIGKRTNRFALTDQLTRLFNRSVGLNTLEREIERSKRSHAPLTVMMLDLDDFKQLNDRYGHLRGDDALRTSAEVLTRTLRQQDTVCRYGGEEFMVVLPETSLEQASIIAARVFTEIEQAGHREAIPLTVSIGLTEVAANCDSVESVLGRADHALYASKARGRNRFSVDTAD